MPESARNEDPPGSDKAAEQGCTCARMDNGYGRGYLGGMKGPDGHTLYMITQGCPLHGVPIVDALLNAAGR